MKMELSHRMHGFTTRAKLVFLKLESNAKTVKFRGLYDLGVSLKQRETGQG